MKEIKIEILRNGSTLRLRASTGAPIATQYDHKAQKFVFVRPTEFKGSDGYNLWLYLTPKYGTTMVVNIGAAEEYVITNALTQTTLLGLEVAIKKGSDFRIGANSLVYFDLTPAAKGGATPEPIPDPVVDLIEHAATAGYYDADEGAFVFTNRSADTTFTIPFVGGGGGGIYSPDITSIRVMDRAEYDAIPTKGAKTLYLIRG